MNNHDQFKLANELADAVELRELARSIRSVDPRWARVAYRLARNRLAAIRRGDLAISRWYIEPPVAEVEDERSHKPSDEEQEAARAEVEQNR